VILSNIGWRESKSVATGTESFAAGLTRSFSTRIHQSEPNVTLSDLDEVD
jgi:hypothetical protein